MNNMSATIAPCTKKRKMAADLAAEAAEKRVKTSAAPAEKQSAEQQPAPAKQPAAANDIIDLVSDGEGDEDEGKGSTEAAEEEAISKVTTKVDAEPARQFHYEETYYMASSCPNKEKQVPHPTGVMVEEVAAPTAPEAKPKAKTPAKGSEVAEAKPTAAAASDESVEFKRTLKHWYDWWVYYQFAYNPESNCKLSEFPHTNAQTQLALKEGWVRLYYLSKDKEHRLTVWPPSKENAPSFDKENSKIWWTIHTPLRDESKKQGWEWHDDVEAPTATKAKAKGSAAPAKGSKAAPPELQIWEIVFYYFQDAEYPGAGGDDSVWYEGQFSKFSGEYIVEKAINQGLISMEDEDEGDLRHIPVERNKEVIIRYNPENIIEKMHHNLPPMILREHYRRLEECGWDVDDEWENGKRAVYRS